jgi:hypothetical protein
MTKPAVIDGSLVDVRNVNQHKCVRLIVDVPAERAREVIDAFGWPTMVNPVSVAIARLTEQASQQPRQAVTQTAPAGAKSYAQRIALLCQDRRFQKFLQDRTGLELNCEARVADYVRDLCEVQSRAEIVEGSQPGMKWRSLAADYDVWRRDLA